jgi:hypothetical protein
MNQDSGGAPGGCAAIGSSDVIYGTNLETSPFYPNYEYYRYAESSTIILQSEFGSGEKQIWKLGVYMVGGDSGTPFTQQSIRIAHINLDEFDTTPTSDDTDGIRNFGAGGVITDFQICHANFGYTYAGAGWYTIELTTPFCYNGVDNLLIIWRDADAEYTFSYKDTYVTDQGFAVYRAAYYRSDTTPIADGVGYFARTEERPDYRLYY